MPRDMTGTARYAPQPRYPPFAFYSAVRLGDPEMLGVIMATDPYWVSSSSIKREIQCKVRFSDSDR